MFMRCASYPCMQEGRYQVDARKAGVGGLHAYQTLVVTQGGTERTFGSSEDTAQLNLTLAGCQVRCAARRGALPALLCIWSNRSLESAARWGLGLCGAVIWGFTGEDGAIWKQAA